MRITIAAIGRLGRGPEQDRIADYARRVAGLSRQTRLGPLDIREIDERSARDAAAGAELLRRAADGAALAVLDERGEALDSVAFSRRLQRRRDQGEAAIAFLIGGADGHDPALRAEADWLLSLGPMTWPHALARLMLVEQIYRAAAITAGHPYHRA